MERETTGRRKAPEERKSRAFSSRDEVEVEDEAEYYNRRASDRAYMGEAYNGFTKDWAIVDVPPGTRRVEMEGVGGAKEEVTWQRYNGVRRSNFIPESGGEVEIFKEKEVVDTRDRGRRFVAEKTRDEGMWTEITKDLVVKEAIEASGYDFEETEFFFYVMNYLRYVSLRPCDKIGGHADFWGRRTSYTLWSSPKTSVGVAKNASARSSGRGNICRRGGDRWSWNGMRRGCLSERSPMTGQGLRGGICDRWHLPWAI